MSPEHLEARREQILAGARSAFARHGYEGTTVARLEQAVGLSRGAIFNYFPSKWAIFEAIAFREGRRYFEIARAEGLDAVVREISTEAPEWLGVHLEAMNVIRTDPAIRERALREGEGNIDLVGWLGLLQEEGVLRRDVSARDLARFVTAVLDGLSLRVALGLEVDLDAFLRLLHGGIDAARAPAQAQ